MTPWIFRLSIVVAALGAVAAAAGLFWPAATAPAAALDVRGLPVQLYGSGLYRFDSVLSGAAFRGTDVVTLLLAVPFLVVSALAHRRGSLRGSLLLSGALCYFLYVYASLSFAAAFNELFLVYVALLSASFFAFVLLLGTLLGGASQHLDPPRRRGTGTFLIVAGTATIGIWLAAPLSSLLAGRPPVELGAYTTLFTHALDMAIIGPAVILGGVLIRRADPRGIVVAFPLLCLLVAMLPVIVAQTWAQLAAGIMFSAGQVVGIIGGFLALACGGVWATWLLLRSLEGRAAADASLQGVHAEIRT